jgi:hypothetical protein
MYDHHQRRHHEPTIPCKPLPWVVAELDLLSREANHANYAHNVQKVTYLLFYQWGFRVGRGDMVP